MKTLPTIVVDSNHTVALVLPAEYAGATLLVSESNGTIILRKALLVPERRDASFPHDVG